MFDDLMYLYFVCVVVVEEVVGSFFYFWNLKFEIKGV